jgi:signal transduction histidine kinase
MSLRAKLLLLWLGLAVAPLLVIGVFEYYHSARSLRTLIASQVAAISQRAAAEVADGYARRVSDLLLVAENAETQRFYEVYATGDGGDLGLRGARGAAEAYLNQAWGLFGSAYDWMELRDSADVPLLRFGLRDEGAGEEAASWQTGLARSTVLAQPVLSPDGGRRLGTVVARVPLGRILPRELLETTFGRAGYSTVIDRSADRVLYHPRQALQGGLASALLGPSGWDVDPNLFQREEGIFTFRDHDSTRVASFTSLAAPPWTVIATGAVEEFAPAVLGMRLGKLLLVLLVAGIASLAFVLVVRTGTRSLLALTSAADQVGAGNFAPRLPEPGQDEVGRLTTAFGLMVERVEEMVRQIEASRHMAVVGEFASQISHEVRNPLTTLKLNLQTLQRAAERGRIPEDQEPAVETCLQEIQRLDRVVKGVLALGRPPAASFAPCSVHEILDAALRVARPQGRQRGVRVDAELVAGKDRVSGDAGQLEAAFLNLLLNGLDAAEGEGGRVLVTTEDSPGGSEAVGAGPLASGTHEARSGGSILIRITDSGVGIDPAARDRIFRPFYSSKSAGSGFGLPLALRTIEEHRGRLELEEGSGSLGGASFRIELPLLGDETGSANRSESP